MANKKYGIRTYVIWLTVVPFLIMSICIEAFFLHERFIDLNQDLKTRGELIARQLAASSEYGIFSNNRNFLLSIANNALLHPDVISVSVLNAADNILVRSDKKINPADSTRIAEGAAKNNKGHHSAQVSREQPIFDNGEYLLLYQPIQSTQLVLDVTDDLTTEPLVGAVIIKLSWEKTKKLKSSLLWLSLYVNAAFFLLTMLLVRVASQHIIIPIKRLSHAIQLIGSGQLQKQTNMPCFIRELFILTQGVEKMTEDLQLNFEHLETLVKKRTIDLQESVLVSNRALSELQRQKFVIDNHAIVSICGIDGRISYCNDKLLEVSGYTYEELIGQNHDIMRSGQHPKGFFKSMYDTIIGGGIWHAEVCNRARDGSLSWFDTTIAAFMGVDGRPYEYMAVRTDITERKRVENEARLASLAKSEFIANMSHEIRTPMNSIIGMTYLALNTEMSDSGRNYLEKIQFSGMHLLGIIEEILDFSKISAQKLRLEEVDFELADVINSASILFEQRIKDKGLAFRCEIDPALPAYVCGDPLRLGQVLINYISNAIKFTDAGRIEVCVKKTDENEHGVLLRFEVRDDGIGISDAAKSRLFQLFQQADSSTTRLYGGTGLGLSICKQLIELMPEGLVGMESAPDKGSLFWCTVRFKKGRMPAAVQSITNTNAQITGLRILVAEDHPFNQEVITDVLVQAGAIVCIAPNGKVAIEKLEQQQFDCLLLDNQMPVMDGFETIKFIRENPAFAHIPVIAMTANASNEDRSHCLAAGMDDFIGKPFNPAELFNMINKWVCVSQQKKRDSVSVVEAEKLIDLSVLAQWIGDDTLKLTEFSVNFVNSAQQDLIKIDAAIEREDFATIATLAHHVNSPAKMVGAIEFSKLCRTLEKQAKTDRDVAQLQGLAIRMRSMLNQIAAYLSRERE